MSTIDYGLLAKKARDAVQDLEEPFRSLAYSRILDELLRKEGKPDGGSKPPEHAAKRAIPNPTPSVADDQDPVEAFLSRSIDANPYADLLRGRGHLVEKCLAVLKMARDEFGIDGLGAVDLYNVLVKKFRVAGVHQQNISRDLGSALQYVSRIQVRGRPKYLLTAAGEQHLSEVISAPS